MTAPVPAQITQAIVARGLVKSFGTTKVLRGVDFSVPAGSVFCLLGSNGAGKSTTIRILATLLKPDGGSASVAGYDVVRQARRVRRRIALTGQAAAVDDLLTGRENLALAGELFHNPDPERRADALLEQFGLTQAATKRAGYYSGGMRRRLDIAMGLTGEPSVIFLDEPTTGLDPQNRIEMWHIIDGLAADGTTVFLTTQYLDEAERLASRVAILHEGRIIAQGTPAKLKELLASDGSSAQKQGTVRLTHDAQGNFSGKPGQGNRPRSHRPESQHSLGAGLPGSRIVFDLATPAGLDAAAGRLALWQPVADPAHLTVTIATDGSFADLARAVCRLDGVGVVSMEQGHVSLEDVFLRLVGSSQELSEV